MNGIKITCDQVDLRTQNGLFLASGQVAISGESFECLCERLTIHLHEDRLMLDGKAQVKLLGQKADQAGKALLELSGPQLSVAGPTCR